MLLNLLSPSMQVLTTICAWPLAAAIATAMRARAAATKVTTPCMPPSSVLAADRQ